MLKIVIIACLALTTIALPAKYDNPELNGGGYQGDMLFPPKFGTTRGVGSIGAPRRWPNRIIPYDISAISDANDRQLIVTAMNQLMYDVGTAIPNESARQVCVFFRPAQASDPEVLKIQYGTGCSATVGYWTNYQKTLNLAPSGCFYKGIIQHELTHVLGFFHEQSRPDRDSYITVNFNNIESGQAHNFERYEWGQSVENQGSSYDYGSIMHYPTNAFSSNGQPTITTRQANAAIGQREKLSPTDIAEIRHYYQC